MQTKKQELTVLVSSCLFVVLIKGALRQMTSTVLFHGFQKTLDQLSFGREEGFIARVSDVISQRQGL